MKNNKNITDKKEITIKQIENKNHEYLAYYKSDFLKSTFCVSFRDDIFGAVSLSRFTEMIKTHFNEQNITLFISDKNIKFKSQALLDELTQKQG